MSIRERQDQLPWRYELRGSASGERSKAYNGCSVMAGRVLEGIRRYFSAKKVFL
jgi:hypothetical protein